MPSAQLVILPPGEKQTPPLPPHGFPWLLSLAPGSHARMIYRCGHLYVAMLHGKTFPTDLTGVDHDRAAAFGVLLDAHAFALPAPDPVPRERVEMLGRLILSALPPGLAIRVCRAYDGPDVLRVHVTPPGVTLAVSEPLWEEYAERLPALRDLIVQTVRRHRAAS